MRLDGKQKAILFGLAIAVASGGYLLYYVYKVNEDVKKRHVSKEEQDAYIKKYIRDNTEDDEEDEEELLDDLAYESEYDCDPIEDFEDKLTVDNQKIYQDRFTPYDPDNDDHPYDYNSMLSEGTDEDLKYDKDSTEAELQYRNMLLAGFAKSSHTYKVINSLWDTDFTPGNTKDDLIYNRIKSRREEFFGEDSVWTEHVVVAEVILDFALTMDFDFNGGIERWANAIVERLDPIEDPEQFAINLERGSLINQYGEYGLFSLTLEDLTEGPNESISQQFWDWQGVTESILY